MMKMTPAEFADAVMRRLGPVEDPEDGGRLHADAMRMCEAGWSMDDVVATLLCTEEVSPDLPEDVALRRMHDIWEKYNRRMP